ncbi:receptor-type adenylate cyclase [Trypanosoma conorhini]|uniref:Receptor-type adenylate cyclase n=1 Tax=Trypanosoma conorhini TaxID=83891 RepID=A0A3R7NCE8_9TRYP|nr:receptor-type adenylate cyclase [Trypanosoma conorhini]RNF04283.1 receptor-type adenylate cyclase [Trypanosoma conorhini]
MYQLDAVPGRTFAPLRLDRLMPELDGDGEDATGSGDASASSCRSCFSQTAFAVLALLGLQFGIFAAPQRLRVLRPLCERWRVAVPHAVRAGIEEDACRVAMERLAVKISRVMEKSSYQTSVESEPRKTTMPLMSSLHGDDGLCPQSTTDDGDGRLGEFRSRSSLCRTSSFATEEVCSGAEDSASTIRIRPPV